MPGYGQNTDCGDCGNGSGGSFDGLETLDTASIDFTGDGTTTTPLEADVKVSADANNIISIHADGVYATGDGTGSVTNYSDVDTDVADLFTTTITNPTTTPETTFTKATQAAGLVYASHATLAAQKPSFRALVESDLPALTDAVGLAGAVILLPTTSARNTIQPSDAAVIPLTVKGFAAQSDDLLELQSSAAVVYSRFNATGNLSGRSAFTVNWSSTTDATGSADVGLARHSAGILRVTDGAGGIGNLYASNLGVKVAPLGNVGLYLGGTVNASSAAATGLRNESTLVAAANGDTLRGAYIVPTFTPGAFTGVVKRGLQIDAGADDAIPLYIKLAATPSVNAISVVSSSDSQLFSVSSNGAVTVQGAFLRTTGVAYNNTAGTSYMLLASASPNSLLIAANATHIPLVVRGAASQSANLLELQTSTPTTVFSVSATGAVLAGTTLTVTSTFQANAIANFIGDSTGGVVRVSGLTATGVGIRISLAASHSAEPFQIWNGTDASGGFAANGAPFGRVRDAGTTTIVAGLTVGHNSSGTPAAGFGTSVVWQGKTTTTENTEMGRLALSYAVATHASRTVDGNLYATDNAGERTIMSWQADGSAPRVAWLGAAAVVRQAFIADPTGGAIVDAESRTAINAILDILIAFGLMASS